MNPALPAGHAGASTPAPLPALAAAEAHAAPLRAVRVSVVVPTCGRPQLLARCLMALLAQQLDDGAFEVIVVDDGRCDATQAMVQQLAAAHPQVALRYLRTGRPPRQGPALARNVGWRAAHGDVVAFTDDDTLPLPGWLARGEAALRFGGAAAVAGRVVVPRPDERPAGTPPSDHERMTQGLESAEFVTANAFVWRHALQRLQGFDERFTRAWREDTDLQYRLQDEIGPLGRCPGAVVLHPVRPERWGVSLRQQRNAYFEALLYAKHPRRYRQRADARPPWDYYAIVALTLAALALAAAGVWGSVAVAAALALALVLRFAARRLRGTSHAPGAVAEMLATSLLIPFLSVGWRLRGAWHFRVWFL